MDDLSKSVEGLIFDIQRYSIHDGPGIRTIVFLKGCPLRCIWCQNPEGQNFYPEVGYNSIKCISCGMCVQICPNDSLKLESVNRIDYQSCNTCGKCVDECYAEALIMFGRKMTVEDVITIIEKDRPFYHKTKGGITLSGGEPIMQKLFVQKLLMECKIRGIDTTLETSGHFNWQDIAPLLKYLDLILFDIKLIDNEKHQKYCGVSNEKILDNAQKLAKLAKKLIFRIPIIPGVNDGMKNIQQTCSLIKETGIKELHLIPYHKLGHDKYRILGRIPSDKNIKPINEKSIEFIKKRVQDEGLVPHVIY